MSRRGDLLAMVDPAVVASYVTSGTRIVRRAVAGHHRSAGDAPTIIRDVLERCWDGDHYDASAGHFRQFWTRDLGFSAVPLVRLGYADRVRASLAWALDAWAVRGSVTTTIFPGRRPRDVYRLGIDSLPLALHALRAVDGSDLLGRHGSWLGRAVTTYATDVVDPSTGLVRDDRRYSTHRDTVRTSSNCYANTMATLLSTVLRDTGWFPDPMPGDGADRLVESFWRGDRFVDDRATGAVTGDAIVFPFWLGIVEPGLGSAAALATAARLGLADPLPLRYAPRREREAEDPVQRLFVPDYQGSSIWTSLGAIYLSLLDAVDPEAATSWIDGYRGLVERDGTFWEVLTPDLRPYRGRLGLFRADEGMLWSAIFLELLDRRQARERGRRPVAASGEAGGPGDGHEGRSDHEPRQQTTPPGDERDAGADGEPLDADMERR